MPPVARARLPARRRLQHRHPFPFGNASALEAGAAAEKQQRFTLPARPVDFPLLLSFGEGRHHRLWRNDTSILATARRCSARGGKGYAALPRILKSVSFIHLHLQNYSILLNTGVNLWDSALFGP